MSVKLIFWSQDPKNKNRNRHCWTFLCCTSRGRERGRESGREATKWSDREIWRTTATNLLLDGFILFPHPAPTAPSALPAAGAVKIYLSYKFCGASLSLFLYCSTAERAESSAESEKHLIILFLCHSQCLQNSLCTEKWRRSQAEIETNQSGWQSFLFCFVLSCPLPNLYIVAAAVVSLFRSLYLCVCCEKL